MKAHKIWLCLSLCLSMTFGAYGEDVDKIAPQNGIALQQSFSPILKQVSPAIVNISATQLVSGSFSIFENDPFFNDFFQMPRQQTGKTKKSLGSAVIINSQKGWILTNNHVVSGAQDIYVNMDDEKSYKADILWQDKLLDLAILVFVEKPASLTAIEFSNSDEIEVGDLVLAVGNPFGLGKTVTMGIISAVDRKLKGSLGRFLQTDAAINPGNSGGGLITTEGKLAGLNTLIISRSGGSQGLGFAVPSNLLSHLIAQIDDNGERKTLWLGATFEDSREGGVRVKEVWADSHSAKAGLRPNDVVIAFNGRKIENMADLKLQEYYTAVGSLIELELLSGATIKFEAAEAIEYPPQNPVTVVADGLFYQVTFINRSPKVSQKMNLKMGSGGVIISDIPRRSLAERMGFRIGDIILSLNNIPLNTTNDLKKVDIQKGGRWHIEFERDGKIHQATIRY